MLYGFEGRNNASKRKFNEEGSFSERERAGVESSSLGMLFYLGNSPRAIGRCVDIPLL